MTERLVISSSEKDVNKNIEEVCNIFAKLIYNLKFEETKVIKPLPISDENFRNLSQVNNHFIILPTYFRNNNHENLKYITRMIHIVEVYKQMRFVIKYLDNEDSDSDSDTNNDSNGDTNNDDDRDVNNDSNSDVNNDGDRENFEFN